VGPLSCTTSSEVAVDTGCVWQLWGETLVERDTAGIDVFSTAWWLTYPSEKYESVGMMTFPI